MEGKARRGINKRNILGTPLSVGVFQRRVTPKRNETRGRRQESATKPKGDRRELETRWRCLKCEKRIPGEDLQKLQAFCVQV